MTSTTVVSDDSVTTVIDESAGSTGHRIAWSAVFGGALVVTAVTFFLVALGSGFGLSLVTVRHATANSAITFLTLGAIYFFAAQAFGFAAGGHFAGRLMGPVLENENEEQFLAAAHGLITWALAVVATAALVYIAALATGTAATGGAAFGTAAPASNTMTPAATGYWVDRLFRQPPQATHASLGWRRYAQNDTGTATDVTPPDDSNSSTNATSSPNTLAQPAAPAATGTMMQPSDTPSPSNASPRGTTTGATSGPADIAVPSSQPTPGDIAADKAEAGRILMVGTANGAVLSDIDSARLADLVMRDTGQTEDGATRRVQNVEQEMRAAEIKTAETARKIAAYASLWTALALLFGAIVATMAAISARWEDDRITFGFPGRRVDDLATRGPR
ncbi:MAG TPA: hypothetical protein VGG10_07780 [Rhizomicrobium sp.]